MTTRKNEIVALVAGLVFGVGLAISQMINPVKVIAFLDIAGNWDPSLALVMGAALAVTMISFRFVLRADRPLLHPVFHLPTRKDIDKRLIAGAAIFGAGWGLAGFCPGPALAALFMDTHEPLVILATMLLGSQTAKLI